MNDLEQLIRKYVVKNAHDYGKADPKAIVGKVVAQMPEVKKDMKSTMNKIIEICNEINALTPDQIELEFSKYTYDEKKEEKKEIEIPGAEIGKVVVRFPPEPNGWPHIGHAKAFCLSWEIARKYKGKIILRWDDTNPEAEKAEFVDAIKRGIKWLGLYWDEEVYCSDYMEKMYELCEKLIKRDDAYACTCSQEEIARGREQKVRCACSLRSRDENLEIWKKMLNGEVPEGGAIIRLKGDMSSLNTVMRDPTLFRIVTAPHFRQGKKYRVWPTYDFQGPVMDSLLGITHPIRSKEYELRDELYAYLLNKLEMRVPRIISISRLAIKNAPVSKRLLRPLVESGKLWGWDDPRLPTLAGLERRGIQPEAVRKFVLSFGISKVESEPTIEPLLVENKKILEPISKHYFFVADPILINVNGASPQTLSIPLHPTNAEMGVREVKVGTQLYISGEDAMQLKQGEVFRLKNLYNVEVKSIEKECIRCEYAGTEVLQNTKKIQWVPKESLQTKIFIPGDLLKDGEFNPESMMEKNGLCEPACASLKVNEIVQFERVGFFKLDSKEQELRFIKCD